MEKEETITFRITSELKKKLEEIAEAEDMPVSQLLRKLVKNKTEGFLANKAKGKNNGR